MEIHQLGEIVIYKLPFRGNGLYQGTIIDVKPNGYYKIRVIRVLRTNENGINPIVGQIQNVML